MTEEESALACAVSNAYGLLYGVNPNHSSKRNCKDKINAAIAAGISDYLTYAANDKRFMKMLVGVHAEFQPEEPDLFGKNDTQRFKVQQLRAVLLAIIRCVKDESDERYNI